jgi:small subunit ribosomal protein S13
VIQLQWCAPSTYSEGTHVLTIQVFILNVNFPEQRLVKVPLPSHLMDVPDTIPGPITITDTPPIPQAALETFFGIGPHTSARILARFHIHHTAKVGELSQNQASNLVAHLDGMKIDNDLRRQVIQDIQRLRDTGTYRGRRHAMGLPVRGQNTRNQVRLLNQDTKCWVWSDSHIADKNSAQTE